ncbi:MAG: TonB family protein [Proteobacteria bacterium]|nr:TonB family protein [Pseudomonadota bacterium]
MFRQRLLTCAGILLGHVLLLVVLSASHPRVPMLEAPAIAVQLLAEVAKPNPSAVAPAVVVSLARVPIVLPELSLGPPPEARPLEAALQVPEVPASEAKLGRTNTEVAASPELATLCPQRNPPEYPPAARREREQGEVRLRVELDDHGRIEHVSVVSSSGSRRLDEAARLAVETWRCRPAERDGHGVRSIALQTLAFVLEHR